MLEPPGTNSNSNPLQGAVNKICGVQNATPSKQVTQAQAGGTIAVKMATNHQRTHLGGGCVFSLSYDEGKTFTMIASTDTQCPITKDYDIPIPKNAPSGKALFVWSWVPIVSTAPEYYMTCSHIHISGGAPEGSKFSGPELPILNLKGKEKHWAADKQTTPWVNEQSIFPNLNKIPKVLARDCSQKDGYYKAACELSVEYFGNQHETSQYKGKAFGNNNNAGNAGNARASKKPANAVANNAGNARSKNPANAEAGGHIHKKGNAAATTNAKTNNAGTGGNAPPPSSQAGNNAPYTANTQANTGNAV
jgi:hypothetical protein